MIRPASWLVVALMALVASDAAADAAVDLSWTDCSPLVSSRVPLPGVTSSTLVVSVTGLTQPHRGYSFLLWFASELPCGATTSTPDAWRFDTAGCQDAQRSRILVTPPTSTCPAMYGPEPPTANLTEMRYSPADGVTPPGAMRILFAASYNQRVQTPDPEKRYFMGGVRFDHTESVTGPGTPGISCGGYEQPMCFSMWSGAIPGQPCDGARYSDAFFVDLNATYIGIPIGQGQATFGLDPETAFSCFAITPATNSTWGAIKAQYR